MRPTTSSGGKVLELSTHKMITTCGTTLANRPAAERVRLRIPPCPSRQPRRQSSLQWPLFAGDDANTSLPALLWAAATSPCSPSPTRRSTIPAAPTPISWHLRGQHCWGLLWARRYSSRLPLRWHDLYGFGRSVWNTGSRTIWHRRQQHCRGVHRPSGVGHGFLYHDSTFTTLDDPLATTNGTYVSGISGNIIVGYYQVGPKATASSTTAALTPHWTIPWGTRTYATGISGNNIVGHYTAASGGGHGFLYNDTTYTTLDYPLATQTEANGISGANIVAGITTTHRTASTASSTTAARTRLWTIRWRFK